MNEPFATFSPNTIGLEKSKSLKWLIPNKLGGYSSSTILDLPTNRYQSLLVSACENLKRRVYLEGFEEEILIPETISLKDPRYKGPGKFEFSQNSISYHHYFEEFDLIKRISPLTDKNGVIVLYTVTNKLPSPINIRIKVLVNSREVNDLGKKEGIGFQSRFFTDKILGVSSTLGYLTVYSDKAQCAENSGERWDSFLYSNNAENFYYTPAYFEFILEGNSIQEFTIAALAYETEEKTAKAFKSRSSEQKSRVLSSGIGSSILALLNIANTFMVEIDSKKTIISYPSNEEPGRGAMISLPGLTLINGRYKEAELVFERFLNHATRKGIPSSFSDGKPRYEDIDTSLWLIDRLYKYRKSVGEEKAREFLHTYWWELKDMMKNYGEMERNSLLMHNGGTWIPGRKNAVEVQGLWYNSLKIMGEFSELMDDEEIDFGAVAGEFEENFLESFWAGSYLKDTLEDDSLRPNQLIAITLEFTPVNETLQKKVLNSVEELFTDLGLRTLSPKDDSYTPNSKFNGAVFPWLLGPYLKLLMRLSDRRLYAKGILENIFEKHTREAGMGTVSEFFSGEDLTPGGNISHAPAVAELIRAYFEDVMGRRQQPLLNSDLV